MVSPDSGLEPGGSSEGVATLRARLKIEGDLAPDAPPSPVFDAHRLYAASNRATAWPRMVGLAAQRSRQ